MTLTVLSCGTDPERTLLTQFFAASRLRDLTALGKISTVVFEPASDGIVTSFEITRVTPARGPDGQVVSKDVSIVAPVKLPAGRSVAKTFVITIRRGLPGSNRSRWGGWMVTAITDGPASPSTPRP